MEDAIKKIIEIEHEAQGLVDQGHAQTEKIQMGTVEELKNMEESIFEMSKIKVEELREKGRSEADAKLEKIEGNTQGKIRMLETYVENNRGTWERQIFDRILGR